MSVADVVIESLTHDAVVDEPTLVPQVTLDQVLGVMRSMDAATGLRVQPDSFYHDFLGDRASDEAISRYQAPVIYAEFMSRRPGMVHPWEKWVMNTSNKGQLVTKDMINIMERWDAEHDLPPRDKQWYNNRLTTAVHHIAVGLSVEKSYRVTCCPCHSVTYFGHNSFVSHN